MEEEMIERIKEVCFKQDITYKHTLHKELLNSIVEMLSAEGFNVESTRWQLENRKFRYKHIHSRTGEVSLRKIGILDIFAEKEGFKIAIEFDNGTFMKTGSVEKLLQSKANMNIGIVKGISTFSFLKPNTEIIQEEAGKLKIKDREIWLVIIGEKVAEKIRI
jgi:hypothetical protein